MPGNMLRRLRARAAWLSGTPFHPQWLIGSDIDYQRVAGLSGTVLDVGCGRGAIRESLASEVEYIGLDYPPTGAVDYAARPRLWADAQALPIADNSVDAVLLLHVLEHVPDPSRALSEAYRVLRSGGQLILEMPLFYPLHDIPNDYSRWTPFGLEQQLLAKGFTVEALRAGGKSMQTAGALGALALANLLVAWLEKPRLRWILAPLLPLGILLTNLCAALLARLEPPNRFLPGRVSAVAVK